MLEILSLEQLENIYNTGRNPGYRIKRVAQTALHYKALAEKYKAMLEKIVSVQNEPDKLYLYAEKAAKMLREEQQ